MQSQNPARSQALVQFSVLAAFLFCYVASAFVLQVRSHIPPHHDGSPMEYFTVGLLWMLSLICLLKVGMFGGSTRRMVLWTAMCVALALLAIDEALEFHEVMDDTVGDDDHFKVILWLLTGAFLYVLHRLEGAPSRAAAPLIVGYLFHSLYILSEIGDGDYFHFPGVSLTALKWCEESCELFFLASYLLAFLIYLGYGRTGVSAAGRAMDK